MWSQLLMIVAPLAGREVVHWRAVPRPTTTADGKLRGGYASAACWNVTYLALLAWAVLGVFAQELWHGGAVGIPLLWLGSLLRAWAYRALGKHYTVTVFLRSDHALVQSGPYRWLRHPLHLGLNVEMLGLALMRPGVATLCFVCVCLVVLLLRNRHEERALVDALGDSYRQYRHQAWDVIDLLPVRLRGP
jgi:protein-S-isoprenylcysteine O-methyltransferase Ste14